MDTQFRKLVEPLGIGAFELGGRWKIRWDTGKEKAQRTGTGRRREGREVEGERLDVLEGRERERRRHLAGIAVATQGKHGSELK